MKIITLHQPWASLIAYGLKRFETRSWSTSYRGRLLIHAAKRLPDLSGRDVVKSAFKHRKDTALPHTLGKFPYGALVASCELTNCILITQDLINQQTDLELLVGCWEVNCYHPRFAWKLENIQLLESPITAKGQQGLWNVPLELERTLLKRTLLKDNSAVTQNSTLENLNHR